MTEQEYRQLIAKPTVAKVNEHNPEVHGNGRVRAGKQKPNGRPALGEDTPEKQRGSASLAKCRELGPMLRICLISVRHRLITDFDNFPQGYKPLRDSIARSLGIDDADRFIDWRYGQCESPGKEETIVIIETLWKL